MLKKLSFCLLVCIFAALFLGNIWFWEDDQGVKHYSNVTPPTDRQSEQLKESRRIEKKIASKKYKGHLFRVTRVFDGDTIQVTGLDLKFTIRMVGIDSPEIGYNGLPSQPYSRKAKNYLTSLLENKKVRLKSYGTGGYNRQLAEIFLGDTNINIEMIRQGLAEVYGGKKPRGLDSKAYYQAEEVARKDRKGMWIQGKSYKSPWQWRKKYPRK